MVVDELVGVIVLCWLVEDSGLVGVECVRSVRAAGGNLLLWSVGWFFVYLVFSRIIVVSSSRLIMVMIKPGISPCGVY